MVQQWSVCDLQVVRHGYLLSIQNRSTVTNPTTEPYCILLPLTLPWPAACKSQTLYYQRMDWAELCQGQTKSTTKNHGEVVKKGAEVFANRQK